MYSHMVWIQYCRLKWYFFPQCWQNLSSSDLHSSKDLDRNRCALSAQCGRVFQLILEEVQYIWQPDVHCLKDGIIAASTIPAILVDCWNEHDTDGRVLFASLDEGEIIELNEFWISKNDRLICWLNKKCALIKHSNKDNRKHPFSDLPPIVISLFKFNY